MRENIGDRRHFARNPKSIAAQNRNVRRQSLVPLKSVSRRLAQLRSAALNQILANHAVLLFALSAACQQSLAVHPLLTASLRR